MWEERHIERSTEFENWGFWLDDGWEDKWLCGGPPPSRTTVKLDWNMRERMIFRANDAFGMTVLWSTRTRHANSSTMSVEEGTGGGVIKLTTIIALDGLDRGAKLSGNIRKKARKSWKCVRFKAYRKSPRIMRTIVKNYKIIFITTYTRNGRCPQITMY